MLSYRRETALQGALQFSPKVQCESKKSSPPKTFCNIFTWVKDISVKFCQYVASLYLYTLTNFGWFVLIFNKMAWIFLGAPIVFNVPVSSVTKSNRRDFVANNEWSPIHPTSIHWIIRLRELLVSYYKLQPKLKTAAKFTEALELTWSA